MAQIKPAGEVLREWRQRRRMTQFGRARDAVERVLKGYEPYLALATLHDEPAMYRKAMYRKAGEPGAPPVKISHAEVVLPMEREAEGQLFSLFSTTMVSGTPVDVPLSELAIESFFPADKATANATQTLRSKFLK